MLAEWPAPPPCISSSQQPPLSYHTEKMAHNGTMMVPWISSVLKLEPFRLCRILKIGTNKHVKLVGLPWYPSMIQQWGLVSQSPPPNAKLTPTFYLQIAPKIDNFGSSKCPIITHQQIWISFFALQHSLFFPSKLPPCICHLSYVLY